MRQYFDLVFCFGALVAPEALVALEPFIMASNSWRLSEPSWFVSALAKSGAAADAAVLPLAVEELFGPDAAFTAASNSWRLNLPSWFVSALVKSRRVLADEVVPPAEAEDPCCLPVPAA